MAAITDSPFKFPHFELSLGLHDPPGNIIENPRVLYYISWRVKEVQKYMLEGQMDNFLSFSYIFLCIPEVVKGPY